MWEEDTSYRTNAVRVTLSKLRTKLGAPPVIETVPGAGYRIGDGPVGRTGSGTAPLPGIGSTAPLPGIGSGTSLPGTGSATP